MKCLVNLSNQKRGGGQTVALNFLCGISKLKSDHDFIFAVACGTELHHYLKRINEKNVIVLPRSPFARILVELFLGWIYIYQKKIDIVYTCFGYSLLLTRVPQVSGSADSNLYYPDLDFWSECRGISKLFKQITDQYRIFGLKQSYAVIFENHSLMLKARELYDLPRTTLINPSLSILNTYQAPTFVIKNNHAPKGLFLCGWQLHKGIMLIPHIARELKSRSIEFQFILTAPPNRRSLHNQFMSLSRRLMVDHMIDLIGPVQKQHLPVLYDNITFSILLSKLESFSNNIIESWYFGKPLIVTDADWSRSICCDAAYYVDRESPSTVAAAIETLLTQPEKANNLVIRGKSALKLYPTPSQRAEQEINYLIDCLAEMK